MLKLYNKEHVAISTLTNLKDFKIEYVLSGEDLLEFSLSRYDDNISILEEEYYIKTKDNEYVIKSIDPNDNFKRFTCNINIEDLVGKAIYSFDTSNNNINDTIRLAISGTGWILADNNITKRRTIKLKNTNALNVLREVRKVFRVDFRFDSINKIIYVYEQFGEDRGVYFTDELNLISLDIPSDSYDYVTRLYPIGKDGLIIESINNGKNYIENFQYSNKVLELIWEDNRYTDINSLKEDAEAKLEELSKPKRNYNVQVYDLAKNNSEFSFLDFFLGDTITIISNLEKYRDKQRIVKYIQYPEEPSKNTCELGNTKLTFEDLQKENEAKNKILNNITIDNATIDGTKVDNITTEQISDFKESVDKINDLTVIYADIENIKAQNVTITGKLNAVEGEFGTLKSNVAIIDKLTVTHSAQINNLEVNKASINQLNAVSATIGTLEATVGKIETLVNGNLTSINIQSMNITSDKFTVENGFIKNAMIDNVDVSKLNAGDILTSKFRIVSEDGGIEIANSTQQFKDKNNNVRVQIGKDSKGNFNFIIRGEDGTTTLIDQNGIKSNAIAEDLIVSDMIASNSVGEKQIDYNSFITGFNKDTNTSTIKATKIMLNNQNQTLDIAFNSLKTQADNTKTLTESHSTTIGVMQGKINTAIDNTQIVKDGKTILLKDDYNRTVQTIDTMKSTIGTHTSQIDGLNVSVNTQNSAIEQLKNQISLKVEEINTNINELTRKTSEIKLTSDKINWLVSSGTSSSNMELTSDALKVISNNINLNGKVTFNSFSSSLQSKFNSIESIANATNKSNWDNAYNRVLEWCYGAIDSSTTINGGLIEANTITSKHILSKSITGDKIFGGVIEGTQLKTSEPYSNGGMWIRDNGMQLGQTSFMYDTSNRFAISSKDNIVIANGTGRNIFLMPSEYVSISGNCTANSFRIGTGTDAFFSHGTWYSQWAGRDLSTYGIKMNFVNLLGTSSGNLHVTNGNGSPGGIYANLMSTYSLDSEYALTDNNYSALEIISNAIVNQNKIIPKLNTFSDNKLDDYIKFTKDEIIEMNANNIIALLWKSVQELKEEINLLKGVGAIE